MTESNECMVPPKGMTQNDLAGLGCGHEDCAGCESDILYINQKCHPGATTESFYDKRFGCLVVACRECKEIVASFQVEKGEVH